MKWWNKKWGKDNICPISQSRLRPGTNKDGLSYVIQIKECKHLFYRNALLEWYKNCPRISSCPVCRTNFDPIQLVIK